jgi:hypothetical protein
MDKKSKLISGLTDRKTDKKPNKYFTDSEKPFTVLLRNPSGGTDAIPKPLQTMPQADASIGLLVINVLHHCTIYSIKS